MEFGQKHPGTTLKKRKLTEKQGKFCNEYLKDLNGTQAAIRAGYSKKSAYRIAVELLNKTQIAQNLQKRMALRAKRTDVTADKVINEIAKTAYDKISNYMEYKTIETIVGYTKKDHLAIYGYKTVIVMKDSKDVDTSNIEQVSIAADGTFKFKLYSRSDALIQLGRHLGLFTDNVNINADINIGICNNLQPQNRKLIEADPEDQKTIG